MLFNDGERRFKWQRNWVSKLKIILQRNGFGYVWENQSVVNKFQFIKTFVKRLKDQYLQDWNETVTNSSKLSTYVQFKQCFMYECYLDVLDIRKFRFSYASFRCSSHDLEIERGRYTNTERNQRLCRLCDNNSIEDEYHFLLCCNQYRDLRETLLPIKYYINPNRHKFVILMSTKNEKLIKSVATFLYRAFQRRKIALT